VSNIIIANGAEDDENSINPESSHDTERNQDADASEAGRALGKLGASKGGKARAQKLTPLQRSEIAKRAVQARWAKAKGAASPGAIPRATHIGTLKIGDIELPCAVLEDGTRLFTQSGFLSALGRSEKPAGPRGEQPDEQLPPFLVAKNLKPFIPQDLIDSSRPVLFRPKVVDGTASEGTGAGGLAYGYKVELLPQVCKVYLDARDQKKLMPGKQHGQQRIAQRCDILIRGLATVGIVALVDEATGYQYDRSRTAMQEILEKFLAKELVAWAPMFPGEFYENLFRLKGMKHESGSNRRPMLFAQLTVDLVYQRLAPGILEQLRLRSPKDEKGRRKNKLFQWLSEDVGHPKLKDHFIALKTLMLANDRYDQFLAQLNRVLPKFNVTMDLPFPIDDENPEAK
jgi:hypothetical protein